MIEAEYIQLVSNVGFPIAAFFYMAFRLEKKMTQSTEALHLLKETIQKCKK